MLYTGCVSIDSCHWQQTNVRFKEDVAARKMGNIYRRPGKTVVLPDPQCRCVQIVCKLGPKPTTSSS